MDTERRPPLARGTAAVGSPVDARAGSAAHVAPRFVVDAHVHLYPCFDLAGALDAAHTNARDLAGDGSTGWLLLTETAQDHAFVDLRDAGRCGRWEVTQSAEPVTLDLADGQGGRLRITAGRQLQTAEGLEIQALGCIVTFPEGLSLEAALARIEAAGALAVVPWGFGKWWGRRGRTLDGFLARAGDLRVRLGDSGQRLAWGPRPKQLARAMDAGRPVLAGSDPLPFPEQAARICAFGMLVEAAIDPHHPFASLARHLTEGGATRNVGSLQNPAAFARNQVRMQLRKRSRSNS